MSATVTPFETRHESESSFSLEVTGVEEGAEGVRVITLASPTGSELPEWTPGAHIDVTLGSGIIRQYSLSSDPDDRSTYRIGVLREPVSRGGSEYVHTSLAVGDRVTVAGPRNHFALADAPRYCFIAGGIGVAPILAQAREARRRGKDYTLVYGGRRRESMAFLDELVREHGDRLVIWPDDEMGIIDLPSLLDELRDDTLIYCCGPGPLLAAVAARSAHWPAGALHVEHFTPKDIVVPDDALDEFDVELTASGTTLHIAKDQSILQAAMDAGVDVFFSCQEGTCGSCETQIIAGEADHRDSVLSPAEQAANTCMMICVSRSACPLLVLDL